MRKTNRAAELATAIGRSNPNLSTSEIAWRVTRLQCYSATLHKIAERQCNGHQTPTGDWDEAAANRDEKREAEIETAARKLCAELGVQAEFSGDPRGAVLKLVIPGQPGDGFGGDYWPVYR